MSHNLAYLFLDLGRNLERADMTTRIVDVNSAVSLPQDAAADALRERLWMNTLNGLSAYQMYRQHVGVHVTCAPVVDFLLRDPHFPRSVAFCLDEIESNLRVLPHYQAPLQVVRHAWHRLEKMDLAVISPVILHKHLDLIQGDLGELHDAITRQYFVHHPQARIPETSAIELVE